MSFTLTFSPALNTTTYPSLTVSGCTFTTSDNGVTYTTTTNPASLTGFNTTPYQSNLVSVTNIPSSVTSIGISAFQSCTSLTSITIPSSVTSIEISAFQSCTSLTSVTIPSSVTSIQSNAFNSCTSLTSIRIPASVTTFGNNAFDGIPTCPPQSSLQQAAILYYGSQAVYNQFYITYAFANTINYVDTTIFALTFSPALNTTTYPSLTVSGCTFTTSDYGVTYTTTTNPASLTGFNRAPYRSNLVSVTNTPNGVTSIANDAFSDCQSLASIQIPNTVTYIGVTSFYNSISLRSITIPNSVTQIASNAFFNSRLISVVIPNSVTTTSSGAFQRCLSLTNFTIGTGLNNFAHNTLNECPALLSITVVPNNATYSNYNNDGNLYDKNIKSIIQYTTGKTNTSFSIPTTVTSIGANAFSLCTALTSITIPSATTSIGSGAFNGCSKLSSVTFTPTASVVSFGSTAFQNCSSLSSINIPASVTSIGNQAFLNCSNLITVTISSPSFVFVATNAFSRSNGKIPILYTTAANYPSKNLSLTDQFTYTYLIGTGPTNYYTIQSGQTKDLSQVFAFLTTNSSAATKFLVENYGNTGLTKDLNQIFEAYQSGSQAQATNFLVANYNGTGQKDLNQIFKPL